MQLVISQTHTLIITGVENVVEPEWYDLEGNVVNPGIRYTESERQCQGRKGAELKKKNYSIGTYHRKKVNIYQRIKKNYNGD